MLYHSRHDPRREAQRQIEALQLDSPSVFVFLGIGLGYTIEHLWENYPQFISALLLVEHDPGVFYYFLHRRDWSRLLANSRTRVVIPETQGELTAAAQSFLPHIMGSGVRLVDHPPSFEMYGDFYTAAIEQLKQFLQRAAAESEFLIHQGALIQRNAILNLPAIGASLGLGPLRNYYRNQPAVLIAAGPSLEKNIGQIAAYQDGLFIFCVDTAYRVALAHGIRPDFVAATDPTGLNLKHFEGIENPTPPVLIFESDVNPEIPRRWNGLRLFLNSAKAQINRWIEETAGPFGLFDQGLSVAHTLYNAAEWLGCDPIFLAGFDLAYPREGGTTHASGTALNREVAPVPAGAAQATILPGPHHDAVTREEILWVMGSDGQPVPTSKAMAVFLHKLSERIKQSPSLVYDATEGGALIEGTIVRRLADILPQFASPTPKPAIAPSLEELRESQDAPWGEAIKDLIKALRSAKPEAEDGLAAAHYLQKLAGAADPADLPRAPEWEKMEASFWSLYRNDAVKTALEQALFASLFLFLRHEKDATELDRVNQYAQYFQSVIRCLQDFLPCLEDAQSRIEQAVQEGMEIVPKDELDLKEVQNPTDWPTETAS
ncbi:MAG: motility associated factor glycosyltransferase family protein [bacterium]